MLLDGSGTQTALFEIKEQQLLIFASEQLLFFHCRTDLAFPANGQSTLIRHHH